MMTQHDKGPGARANCALGHMHRKFARWVRFTVCTRAGALGKEGPWKDTDTRWL